MIQISKITFKDIILEDITFSDGEDLMKLLKGLGKENCEIFDEELQAPRFDKRQDACDEEKKKSRPKILKVNSNYRIYHKIQKLNI